MRYTEAERAKLHAVEHGIVCRWHADQDWKSSKFANYVHNHGDYPECICAAGREALHDHEKGGGT
jgi:hypothetical protein